MFKKLKDKIAEEVKQSPLKIQASMQQLTQAMSPNSSNNTSFVDDIIEEEKEDKDVSSEANTTSEYDSSFTTVDLKNPTPPRNRRLSSTSSVASDLFLTYDFTPPRYNLQSDLESNSEFDDGSSINQLNNVSKENLYEKYRIMLQKYHKYRGRFVDLQKYCKELQRENVKAKNVLTETQDKAIRRITELREQCNLEQEAKAHLEEALRNELEERDHLIKTLNTKIDLLKSGKDCDNASLKSTENNSQNDSSSEIDNLKGRIKLFETLLNKAKDGLTQKSAQIQELAIKLDSDKQTYETTLVKVEQSLQTANDRIKTLQEEIDTMKRKEEEASLSLAENKLAVHKELEAKENQIRNLENKIAEYEKEKKSRMKTDNVDEPDKVKILQDLLTKTKNELNEICILRNDDITLLKQKDALIDEFRSTVSSSNEELFKLKNELQKLDLQILGRDTPDMETFKKELEQSENTIKKLELSLSKKHKEFNNFRTEKELEINKLEENNKLLDEKIEELNNQLTVTRDQLEDKTRQIDQLRGDFEQAITRDEYTVLKNNFDSVKKQNDSLLLEKKLREEIETTLKADKIVLEETLKNTQNELKSVQANSQNLQKKIIDYENERKMYEESQQLLAQRNNQLEELNKQIEKLKLDLEKSKEAEQGMSAQTANLLEQINDLKSKEDEHLIENRKLKEIVKKLKTFENEAKSLNEKLTEKNEEIVKLKRLDDQVKTLSEELSVKDQLINELRGFENEVKLLNEKLSLKEKRINELENVETKIQSSNERLLRKEEEIVELKKFESEMKSLQEKLNCKDKELKELKQFEEQVKSLNEQIQSKNDKIQELKHLENEIHSLKEQLNSKDEVIKELRSSIQQLESSNERSLALDHQIESLNEQLISKDKIINDLQNSTNQLKSLHDKLKSQETELKHLSDQLTSKKETIEEFNTFKTQMIEQSKLKDEEIEKLKVFETETKSLTEKLSASKKSLEKLKSYEKEIKSLNETLNSKNETIKKLESFENESKALNEMLRSKDAEICKLKLFENEVASLNDKISLKDEEIVKLKNLESQITFLNEKLNASDNTLAELVIIKNELSTLQEELRTKNEEIRTLQINQTKQLEDLAANHAIEIQSLNNLLTTKEEQLNQFATEISRLQDEVQTEITKYQNLSQQYEALKINVDDLETFKNMSSNEIERLKSENQHYQSIYSELKSFCDDLQPHLNEMKNLRNENKMLIAKEKESFEKLSELETEWNRLKSENNRLNEQVVQLNETLRNAEDKLENVLADEDANETGNDLVLLRDKIIGIKSDYIKLRYDLKNDFDVLKQYCSDYREQINSRINYIQNYNSVNPEMNLEEIISQYEACKKENESLKNDKKELLIKANDLSKLLNQLESKINERGEDRGLEFENLERRHDMEIKHIILDYEKKLQQKQKEYEELEDKLFLRSDKENAFTMQENRHIISNLQEELSKNQEAYENLFVEHKENLQKFDEEKVELKKIFDKEMKQNDKKWKECLDKMLAQVEEKYKEEITELTKEWSKDRKPNVDISKLRSTSEQYSSWSQTEVAEQSELNTDSQTESASEFLENSANQSDDAEVLKKQVQTLFNELNNCKKMHRKDALSSCNSSRSDIAFDDPVNLEHLRNILYKYMMGIETSAAARVLTEIVKFDNEQRKEILEKAKPKKSSVLEYFGFS